MPNTTTSPNMGLPIPVVGTDPGPDWANNINAGLGAIDSHNHTSGQGVPITVDAIDINADLPLGNNNLTIVRSINFTSQGSPLALGTDIGCIYVSGEDLYYNDESGNQVRITQSGSVAGSSGTITGLPSGTASASYAASTFTFQSATSTPANLAVGPIALGRNVASSKTVTISPNAGQAANFNLFLPAALPVSTSFLDVDSSGNIAVVAPTGTGDVVLDTSPTITTPVIGSPAITTPTFTGNPVGSIVGDTYVATATWTSTAPTINGSTFYYYRVGPIVFINGQLNITSGSATALAGVSIPIPTASLIAVGMIIMDRGGTGTNLNQVSAAAVGTTAIGPNSTSAIGINGSGLITVTACYRIN